MASGTLMMVVLWLGIAHAQSPTTGAIQGVITDAASGEALPGVTVIVSSAGTPSQTALTDGSGAYKINELAPGAYTVTFYYLDLTVERSDIRVGVQKVTPVFHKLDTARAGGEVVRINARAPEIDPTSTAQGITIDSNYLKNMPIPGRTFEAALGAAPGSQGDVLGVAFSGSTSLENQYYVDGVNTTGLTFGTVGSPIINDFIEEIEIITGGYNAEYGRATGGIVNVVTKSGSNDFKGSIFGYWQPGQLTAQAETTPVNAASIDVTGDLGYRADFGFELGGPIVRDKLWFYVGFGPQFRRIDYTRTTKRQTDCRIVLPDDSMSDCDPRLVSAGGNANGAADLDPDTGFYVTETIDSELRHARDRSYSFLGKVNYAATPEQQGQLTVQALPASGRRPGLYGPASGGYVYDTLVSDVSAKWTSKLNNNKTELEATIGVHREDFNVDAFNPVLQATPRQILFNGSLGVWGPGFGESPETNAACADNADDKYPYITNCPMDAISYSIGGPGSLTRDLEQRRSARIGLTQRVRAAGTHEIKAGIDAEDNVTEHTRSLSGGSFIRNAVGQQIDVLRWVQIAEMDDPRARFDQVCYTLPPPTDPDAETEFRCDHLSGTPGAEGTLVRGNTLNWAAYIRDSWQIRPNITINIGVRYEEQRLRYAAHLRGQVNQLTQEPYGKNALVLEGEFAPRVGVLYDWTKEGRSKAYAHWGRFYESIPLATNNLNFGQPIIYLQSYSPRLCGMSDPNIGGPDGSACAADPSITADLRQEMFGVYGSLIAPGVKGQYLDEIVAGVEYELVDDLKLGLSIQNRRFGRVIEDLSVDGAQTYIVANPGDWSAEEEAKLQAKIDATEDVAAKTRLENQMAMFRQIRIFDKPRRDYNALQLTFTRRFGSKLYSQGSYTYARTTGNYPGLISYDDNVILPNASTQYDLIELLANRIGPLPQDRPHYIKLDGYYTHDFRRHGALTGGVRFRALSGQPRNALGPHYFYGDDQSFLLPRGTIGRAQFEHGLDIHLGYSRPLPRNMRVEVFLDLYNIYDNQGVAAVDNTYAPAFRLGGSQQSANPVSGGTYEDLIWVKTINGDGVETPRPIGRNPNFRNTSARYAPAYGRIGARLTF
ncbi:MAG: TonB-dependent receptor [Deltaproteobacteria bacterium]|nr:TonB-dependent receptor [Deltaproteobacteria bacterium]